MHVISAMLGVFGFLLWCVSDVYGERTTFLLDPSWKFELQSATPPTCDNPNATCVCVARCRTLNCLLLLGLERTFN